MAQQSLDENRRLRELLKSCHVASRVTVGAAIIGTLIVGVRVATWFQSLTSISTKCGISRDVISGSRENFSRILAQDCISTCDVLTARLRLDIALGIKVLLCAVALALIANVTRLRVEKAIRLLDEVFNVRLGCS